MYPSSLSHYQVQQQQGAVLVVALIFLMVLSLLGISAMNNTRLETRLAAYAQERNWAFQMAETGLRQANEALSQNLALTEGGINSLPEKMIDTGLDITGIDRGNAVTARSNHTKIQLKGSGFPIPRGLAEDAYGNNIGMAYYESRTTGQSTEDAARIEVNLRSGMRQAHPK